MPPVALSLYNFRAGSIGGAETYVRGLIGAFDENALGVDFTVVGSRQNVTDAVGPSPTNVGTLSHKRFAVGPTAPARVSGFLRGMAGPIGFRSVRSNLGAGSVLHYPVGLALPDLNLPFVVTLHDVQHHVAPQFFSRASRFYRALAYDRRAKKARRIVTVSEQSRSEIIEHLGVSPDRVVAIHHGLDLARFRPGPPEPDVELLRDYDLPARYLYYPANLWPHKNHLGLLEGFSKLEDKSVGLVLSGATYGQLGALEEAATRLAISQRVLHLGYVPSKIVAPLYRQATAVVFPSLYEGFGAPPLEAMACGTPTAVSRIPALMEVCEDAAVSFQADDPVEIAEVVDSLLRDSDQRAELSRKGILHTSKFSWLRSAQAHVAVYHAAAES